jgi:NADPH-dependent curcumin reductase CurA
VPGLLVNNQVRMEGFLVFNFADQYGAAREEMAGWAQRGELNPRTTEFQGLDQAPQAFVELLAGRTVGTTIVRL